MNQAEQLVGLFQLAFQKSLYDANVRAQLWQAVNRRKYNESNDVWEAFNVRDELFRRACAQTAEFVEETIVSDRHGNVDSLYDKDFPSGHALLKQSVGAAPAEGLVLEFGVWRGRSINVIARNTERIVHGFDSFEGIRDDNGIWKKGTWSTGNEFPDVDANVRLYKGWFEKTLEPFLEENPEPVAFVHIDSDTFQAADYVLQTLAPRMVPGTVIQFDEFFNYPGWRIGEYKAFMDFVERRQVRYRFIGYAEVGCSVAMQVQSIEP